MRIIHIQLCVLVWCQAAETLDQLTDLGQNVTINCDLDKEDVYWISLKQSDSPTVILQSFSNPTSAFYLNETFKNKYSVQSKHRLIIYNVTHDDVGFYYCMNTDTPPKLSNSVRLRINEQPQIIELTECEDYTVLNCVQHNETQWQIFIIISALMNGILIILVIACGCYSREHLKHDVDLQQITYMCLQQTEELSKAQYTVVSCSTP